MENPVPGIHPAVAMVVGGGFGGGGIMSLGRDSPIVKHYS
jgi:hypothetical protein